MKIKIKVENKNKYLGIPFSAEEINEEAIKKVFAPCDYCGSRYALREYNKTRLPAE